MSTIGKPATQLAAFMKERHRIYLKKQAGKPAPWTDDPVLQQYRFCNVYRELDTVTIWIRENIREPFADNPFLWFMLCMARRINLPATLEEIMADKKGAWPQWVAPKAGKALGAAVGKWDPERLVKLLDDRTARGEPVYTGAYMITAETGAAHKGKTKSRTTACSNLLPLWQQAATIEPELHHTLQRAFGAILGQGFAWGPFMTYEVVTDLRHTRYLRNAPDTLTWANAGPGAIRGLNRLFDRPLTAQLKSAETCYEMHRLLAYIQARVWPKDWPVLELRDIEHSLCEYDKWKRVHLGEGTPRSKYHPAHTTQGA
jgi:hypothetical protein